MFGFARVRYTMSPFRRAVDEDRANSRGATGPVW
jgi:hypothetical protein